MAQLSTTGVANTAITIISAIERLTPEVLQLAPVVGLIEAAISVFSNEDKQAVQDAYKAKMAQSDQAHKDTQEALEADAEVAGVSMDISGTDASPKGGAQ